MSVVNVFIGENNALCLTDTISYRDGRPSGTVERKCHISTNGSFAFATRGSVAFCDIATEILSDVPCAEHAILVMREVITDIPDIFFKASGGELTLLWFCELEARPKGKLFKYNVGGYFSEYKLPKGVTLAPAVPGAIMPELVDDKVMVKIAKAQFHVKEKLSLDQLCIGGDMHITEINSSSISHKVIGRYTE